MERWQQVESLFQEALQRGPAERDTWLREACNGDSGLQREVASLLANHQEATGSESWPAAAAAQLIEGRVSLEPGQCLGPYRIESFIAAGGMGEVYRATDTRLHREVAIKVSAARFTDRFEREARVIASLNHPHICQLYDIGPNYLVMELVEGPTLADRIRQGALPLEEALAVARQIAEALEAAHEKGRVHRDLKPANVKITPEGVVKLLDFGLAKAAEAAAVAGDPSDSPTQTISATRAGVILGTAAYMSPEQARGIAADKRADIWSFGVVLYEVLTGRHLFVGDTVSDTLAGVLKTDPDWSALPPETPGSIRRLLRRCLQRDRKKRLPDIGVALMEIDEAQAEPQAPAVTAAPRRSPLLWVVATLLAGTLIAVSWSRLQPVPAQLARPVSRWTATLPGPAVSDLALSRDGTHLVYAGATAGADSLILRALDRQDAKPLAGTAAAVGPVFSPDGQWIVFFEGEKLEKVAVTGGPPITVSKAPDQRGRTWGDDDTIVYGTLDGGLMRVPAAGGVPQPLTTPDRGKGEVAHQWPSFLPGAQAIIFTIITGGSPDASQIAVLDLKHGSYRTVVNGGSNARYAPSGHLIFGRSGRLFAAPFDARRLVVTGLEVPVIQDLSTSLIGPARFAFSDSGLLVYLGGGQKIPGRTVEWADRLGSRQASTLPPRLYSDISLSPGGRWVAASIAASDTGFVPGGADIFIGDLERGTLTRLTSEGLNFSPIWAPDGRRVTFSSRWGGRQFLKQAAADGSGRPEVLLEGSTQLIPLSWTPNADLLLFLTRDSGLMQILLLPATTNPVHSKPRRLLEAGLGEGHRDAQVSPNGRWIAYASNESGRFEIYARPFPGLGAKWPISTEGGESPRWSGSGRELFYRDPVKSQLMAVEVQTAPEFRAGHPRPLFTLHSTGPSTQSGLYKDWDVARDGKRFLVINAPEGSETGVRLQAVVNWFEELRRMAPPQR
jgi:serine/threonine-protein kinase